MDAARYSRIEEIFAACCELSSAERHAYLDGVCQGDAELRAVVEELLCHDALPDTFLDRAREGAAAIATTEFGTRDDDEHLPKMIGLYRVVRRLGAGGMGIVYLAEQEQPRRPVAVKVLRPGVISAQAMRRFELEAQVLGQLHHPGIAHIYEARTAGAGPDRLSYFAMEYVDGVPLSAYVQKHKLGTRACLELIAAVCDAVHHAHQKGVIHRDLKPGNILIDAAGQPKILDFGVARATDADVQTVTLQTDVGQLIGTIPYMSPEQVTGVSRDIDVRSDVYALGVLMFELLAGRLPHDIRERTIPEAARIIREEEPTALSSINPHFRGDVATIVAKALEKEKDRRYGSASELAADIRRYLRDEPIAARPASTTYQLRKFARRNRALVGGACATFMAVLAGLAVSLVLYLQAENARDAEEKQRRIAQGETARTRAINDFLLQDILAAPDPWSERGKDVTVAAVLDAAAARVDDAFANQPALEAQVRETLAGSFVARGLYGQAVDQLRRAVKLHRGLASGDSASSALDRLPTALERYADAQRLQGELAGAEATAHEGLRLCEARFGPTDARTGDALYTLGNVLRSAAKFTEAGKALQRCLEIRRAGDPFEKEAIAKVSHALGIALVHQQSYAQARPNLEQALAVFSELHGADHPSVAQVQIDLGTIDVEEAKHAQALEHLNPACETLRQRLGENHSETLSCVRTLALAQHGTGDSKTAIDKLRRVIELSEESLGPDHPETMMAINCLAYIYLGRKEPEQAVPLYERLLDDARRRLGKSHLETIRYASNLAWAYRKSGRLDDAEAVFRDTARTQLEAYGIEMEDTRTIVHSFAQLLQERRKWDDCFAQYRLIADACRNSSIDCGQWRGWHLNGYADALLDAENYDEAMKIATESIEFCSKAFAPDDWRIAEAKSRLGLALAHVGNAAKAETLLTESYSIVAAVQSVPETTKRQTYERLRRGLTKIGRADRLVDFEPQATSTESK